MSNLVETVLLLRSCRISPTVGIGCRSLTIALFACLISTHRRRSPLGLGITTTGEIQEVVLSTFSIASRATSSSSFFSNLSFTVQLLETGHLQEVYPITTISENKRFSIFLTKGPIKRLSLIVRVNVVLNRTVAVDSD